MPDEASPIEILRSDVLALPGILHGFPTRAGGVSTGPRASLNLGYRWGDDPANVAENRRRLAAAAGFDVERLQVTRHVHGTRVWFVGDPLPDPAEFDVLVTDRPGDTLGAFAADCVPILLADPVRRVVAAAHAGWRGTVAGVAAVAVRALGERHGARPADLRVALGPSIGPCCFEVGPEVVLAFERELPGLAGLVLPGRRDRPHVDLRVATRAVLERAGVRPEHIDDRPPCTRCDERFYSFRRDGKDGGVHMGFIGLRPPAPQPRP